MNIELNSPNMMTWCDGEYGNISYSAILNDAHNGKFGDFAREHSPAETMKMTADPDNFEDAQKQLLAIVGGLFMTTEGYLEHVTRWSRLQSQTSLIFGISLVGSGRKSLIEMPHEKIIEADGTADSQDMTITFTMSILEAESLPDGFMEKILRTLGYIFLEHDGSQIPDMYNLFGRMAFQYATNDFTLQQWAVACQVAEAIAQDFQSHMSESALHWDDMREVVSHLSGESE